ncbi:MAG: HPP family protein [Silicimonas sp.]|jgi:CBS-domain-containing membrane protein|uniref:HPP family protein n=1 Tax=Roseitalea porphyridii TaxID=1852022 RepID=UPI0032EC972C
MRAFLSRHQPASTPRQWLLGGLGGLVAIALTGALTVFTGTPLLMAPFGASCALLFSVPNSPLSQPPNVIGGHLVATAVGLGVRAAFPDYWWAAALGVGIAIALMGALRVTHPPAGADPLVVFADAPELHYLVFPVLTGSLVLVATATIYHRLTGANYPIGKN